MIFFFLIDVNIKTKIPDNTMGQFKTRFCLKFALMKTRQALKEGILFYFQKTHLRHQRAQIKKIFDFAQKTM